MSSNRLLITSLALLALFGITLWQFSARQSEDTRPAEVSAKLPKLKKEDIDRLEVTAPGKPAVTLTKTATGWQLAAPLTAPSDQSAVDGAIDKLVELESVGVAATKTENFARLEVDDEKGVHVVAKQGDKVLADLIVGAYKSGNTMVREKSASVVAAAKGSIKFAFDKELKEWRERTVSEAEAGDVQSLLFENEKGTLKFVRNGDDYAQDPADLKDKKKVINPLDVAKIKGIVGQAAHLRAVDFAGPELTADTLGLGATPKGRITLSLKTDAGESQTILHVGNKVESNYYAMKAGDNTIYVISGFAGERFLSGREDFIKKPEAAPPAGEGAPEGLPQGLPPGFQLPPGMHLGQPPGHP